MCYHFPCLRRGKVALVAFVELFCTVCFPMCPQIAWMRWYIVAWLHDLIFLKVPASEDAKSHWLHLFNFSPLCVLKCLLKFSAQEDVKSHWLHLFGLLPLLDFRTGIFTLLILKSFFFQEWAPWQLNIPGCALAASYWDCNISFGLGGQKSESELCVRLGMSSKS